MGPDEKSGPCFLVIRGSLLGAPPLVFVTIYICDMENLVLEVQLH